MNDLPPSDEPRDAIGSDIDGRDINEWGPDLLAHIRGELESEDAAALEARLAESSQLRDERDRLAADWTAWTNAHDQSAPSPTRAGLDELLASVREEAAERRAAAAPPPQRRSAPLSAATDAPGSSDERECDVVALALGQLDGADRLRVQALVDADEALAATYAAASKLAGATRTALSIKPHPETIGRLLAQIAREGDAPELFDTEDVPQPTPARPGRLRILRWLAPLAATAAIVVLALQPPTDRGALVIAGSCTHSPLSADAEARRGESVHAGEGAFHFDDGTVLEATGGPVSVRVVCSADGGEPNATGKLEAGSAEFVLQRGTRLARVDTSHFDLISGRVRIEAHDLADELELRSGGSYARVTGTRFEAAAVDGRLFVIVEEGSLVLGRHPESGPPSVTVRAGEQGMADSLRIVSAALDGRSNGDTFLTPKARLEGPSAPLAPNGTLDLVATLAAGEGGAVAILGFDPSEARFFIRLKGPGERSLLVKVQASMLSAPPPTADADGRGWRLDDSTPYVLRIRLDGLDLEPGAWEARLRYLSYKAPARGTEWLGAVESAPVLLEVRSP